MSRHRRQQGKRARALVAREQAARGARWDALPLSDTHAGLPKSSEVPRTPSQRLLVAVNANPGLSTSQLAKHTGTTTGVASTTLRRIYTKGKIQRHADDKGNYTWGPL